MESDVIFRVVYLKILALWCYAYHLGMSNWKPEFYFRSGFPSFTYTQISLENVYIHLFSPSPDSMGSVSLV